MRYGRRSACCCAPLAVRGFAADFITDRFRGPNVLVRDVEGIQERVHDGKLYLTVKDFLSCC